VPFGLADLFAPNPSCGLPDFFFVVGMQSTSLTFVDLGERHVAFEQAKTTFDELRKSLRRAGSAQWRAKFCVFSQPGDPR
jgi:hypothetical protein